MRRFWNNGTLSFIKVQIRRPWKEKINCPERCMRLFLIQTEIINISIWLRIEQFGIWSSRESLKSIPLLWIEEPIWVRWPCYQWIILVAARTWRIWHSFRLGWCCVLFKGLGSKTVWGHGHLWLLVCHSGLWLFLALRFGISLFLLCCWETLGGRLGKTWNKLVAENISIFPLEVGGFEKDFLIFRNLFSD